MEAVNPYFEFTNEGHIVYFASIQVGIASFVGYDDSQLLNNKFKESNGFKRLNF